MLTARNNKDEMARAFDAGVDDFLTKPFNQVELVARVRSGMKSIALYDELSRQQQGSRELNQQLMSLNHRLEALAITDDLTGLYNRRQAMSRLEEQWAVSDRYQRCLSAVMIDIDHFKSVNDKYGHAAGDMVLREVAAILRRCVRTTDTVCRMGGEEFLIILPYQTMPEAELCAQRCRLGVAAHEFKNGDEIFRITISGGISTRRPEVLACTDLLAEADDALYAAKRAGRNCVQFGPSASSLMNDGVIVRPAQSTRDPEAPAA
jgi:diguanylate cyclase (GGDEF)-like protein